VIEDLCRDFGGGGEGLQLAVIPDSLNRCALGTSIGPALEVRHTTRALPMPSSPDARIHCWDPGRYRPVVDTRPDLGKGPVKAAAFRHDSGS